MVAGRRNQSFFSVNHFRKPFNHQPSEFVIFIVKDTENSSPTPSSTPIRRQIISGLPVIGA
jgi:hypothetical protein